MELDCFTFSPWASFKCESYLCVVYHDFFQFIAVFLILSLFFGSNNFDFLIQVNSNSSSDNSNISVPLASHSGHGVCDLIRGKEKSITPKLSTQTNLHC